MQKALAVPLLLLTALIAALLGVLAYQSLRAHAPPDLTTPYQAVLLSNGQLFIGRLEKAGTAHPLLRDVFYIQSRVHPETKQPANVLVKRGREWHAPDHMILTGSQIVAIEPVKEGSQVAKLIAEQSSQQK